MNIFEFKYGKPLGSSSLVTHTVLVAALTLEGALVKFRKIDDYKKDATIYNINLRLEGVNV